LIFRTSGPSSDRMLRILRMAFAALAERNY
jgi:hypothetical protein